MKTISQEKVEELGKALADFHRNYTEQDMREVLNYALKNRQMDGYPHEIAAMLDSFAKELRKLPQNSDPVANRWEKERNQKG